MTEQLTVYRFHTDCGLVGLGESVGPPFDRQVLDQYLGTDPFDHCMGRGHYNLDMACYDLMGKRLGLPAWKLMGQQVRKWVPMGWWMPCMPPEEAAAEAQAAAAAGYRGLKCKARAFFDVVEQARAIQAVAPPDFRVEFDFNGSLANVERALPVLRRLDDGSQAGSEGADFARVREKTIEILAVIHTRHPDEIRWRLHEEHLPADLIEQIEVRRVDERVAGGLLKGGLGTWGQFELAKGFSPAGRPYLLRIFQTACRCTRLNQFLLKVAGSAINLVLAAPVFSITLDEIED